jgi:archaetidylinositol phosphate synthase
MSHDTWMHRVVRLGVRPLADTRVTPNQLTTLRLGAGIGAGALLAQGGQPWFDLGAALFLVGMLLDRADGDLARLTGKTSRWGHTYDLVSDALSNAIAFVGLGLGLRAGAFGVWAPGMGLVAGVAVAAILWLVMKMERRHGARAGELRGVAGFDADDAMLVLPAMVWLNLADWLLAAASIGAPVFAVLMVWLFRGRLGAAG